MTRYLRIIITRRQVYFSILAGALIFVAAHAYLANTIGMPIGDRNRRIAWFRSDNGIEISDWSSFGRTRLSICRVHTEDAPLYEDIVDSWPYRWIASDSLKFEENYAYQVHISIGFPYRAFRGILYAPKEYGGQQGSWIPEYFIVESNDADASADYSPIETGKQWAFPRKLIWGGAIVNFAIYTIAVFMTTILIRGVVILRRAVRDRCLVCNYTRAGVGELCPECGSHVPRTSLEPRH